MAKRATFFAANLAASDFVAFLLAVFLTLTFVGCITSSDRSSSATPTGNARIKLSASLNGSGAHSGLGLVAPSGASGLESFQVAVSDISLAQDLTTNGSGWSGLTGPLPLFSQDMGDHNSIDSTTARSSAFAAYYIDFCDPASLARLATSKPFTARDTGSYNWVIVNWSQFFKVKATLPMGNGDTLYTHDGFMEQRTYPNGGGDYYITRAGAALTSGPSEAAFVRKNNGGTWFRFLRPLHLTPADLDTNQLVPDTVGRDSAGHPIVHEIPSGRWNVMMVFNPKDLVFGGENDSSNTSVTPDIRSTDSSAYLRVPFLKTTAIPYRDGESVMRETYEFSVAIDEAWAHGSYGMRLELYLIGDNVVAATVVSYPTDGSLAPSEVPTIFFAEDGGSGLNLEDYAHHPIFTNFARKTTAGESGTVHWDPAAAGQTAADLTYHLTEIKRMN